MLIAGHRGPDPNAEPEIAWEDIPRVNEAGTDHDVRENLAQAVRFAVAYRTYYRPFLHPGTPGKIRRQVWFQRLITKPRVNLSDADVQDTLDALDQYCDLLLAWCFDISRRRDAADLPVNLFALDGWTRALAGEGEPAAPVKNGSAVGFDRIVMVPQARSLAEVFYAVSSGTKGKDRRGLGIVLDQLFAGCRLSA
jgi:hypothetical protein